MKKSTRGFALVELFLILAVLLIIALVGVKLYANRTKDVSSQSGASPAQTTTISPAPQIINASDLDKAQTVLDQTDPTVVNADDSAQLDTEADF